MRRVLSALAVLLLLPLAACVSPFFVAKLGLMSGSVGTVWVGEEKFVYVPAKLPKDTLAFETATTGRVIRPGLMYTDGGSIPRVAQILPGFSPWGYGPAYIVHDWIFYGHHCLIDRQSINQQHYRDGVRFEDVNGSAGYPAVTFDESALILAEVIKTLIDYEKVAPRTLPGELISSAVDSPIAAALWDKQGACDDGRVRPKHIAIVWLRTFGNMDGSPPPTWKLSPWEVDQAKLHKEEARQFLERAKQGKERPRLRSGPPRIAEAN